MKTTKQRRARKTDAADVATHGPAPRTRSRPIAARRNRSRRYKTRAAPRPTMSPSFTHRPPRACAHVIRCHHPHPASASVGRHAQRRLGAVGAVEPAARARRTVRAGALVDRRGDGARADVQRAQPRVVDRALAVVHAPARLRVTVRLAAGSDEPDMACSAVGRGRVVGGDAALGVGPRLRPRTLSASVANPTTPQRRTSARGCRTASPPARRPGLAWY